MFIVQEQPDVFVDACVADHRSELLFISVFGRDTAIQQLMARMHQRSTQGGVDQLSVANAPDERPCLRTLVGDPRRLDKVTGRCPRSMLLGNLLHAWIFDPAVLQLDLANGTGWLLEHLAGPHGSVTQSVVQADPDSSADHRVWSMVRELSPLPLLDHWSVPVLRYLQTAGGLVRPPCVGEVRALRIALPDSFSAWLSESVRAGDLQEASASPAEPAAQVEVQPELLCAA